MELKLIHFYPDLMNLYGSYANVSVLMRLLQRCGHTVQVEAIPLGAGGGCCKGADFVFMGAGTERAQQAAMADLASFGGEVKAAAEDGVPMLFAGTAMELLGASVTDRAGKTFEGVGLLPFTSVQGDRRIVGDVYGTTALFPEAVVGFMNKCSRIQGIADPLLTELSMGFGNEAEKGPEGIHWKNVFGSELTGPILVKNPRLLEAVASVLLARRGASLPEDAATDPYAEAGYAITAEQLRLRAESGQ